MFTQKKGCHLGIRKLIHDGVVRKQLVDLWYINTSTSTLVSQKHGVEL